MQFMVKSPKNNIVLTIIILNYNAHDYLYKCLKSISQAKQDGFKIKVIVVDNNSTDNSINEAKKANFANTTFLELKTNRGFAYGNNQGIKISDPQTTHFLFLNPDTTLEAETLSTMVAFFNQDPTVSAATCKLILAKTGRMQPECHRGFPTPWRSFCHFVGLGKLFPNSAIFNGYFLGNLDITKPHQIEACVGAFFMIKKSAGNKVGWWCQDYFFYGEDLDFCFQLAKNDESLWYNPAAIATHFQGISSGNERYKQQQSTASRTTRIMIAHASTQAMRIFYRRNFHYSPVLKCFISFGIKLLEISRVIKARYQ